MRVSERGIALLLVLWVLTVLMVIVFSFSYMTRTESHATLAFKEGIGKKFLAEAGMERGIMELFYRNQFFSVEGSEVWKIDGTPYTVQLGDGYSTIRIMDEAGHVNINSVSDIILKNLLLNLGVQEEEADTIVDSIMDWKDPDDLHRLHGAESDYYMSLPTPYKAKNANFDTLEELLLVKGVTPEILYGSGEKKGIIDFLTVNSTSSQINVNAATKDVLMTIPGMTPEIADGIIIFRQSKEITGIQEIQGILGGSYISMAPYIITGRTSTFTIESVGYKGSGKAGYALKATVILETNNKFRYVYYKSPSHTTQ
ncbi:MAG: general secretion pathway protein GspK [Nitrospirota bacterium]|nr:general secretion pathway protein GspK [Nitrospirota bacterium]MDH5768136.1 general secretion pathway protein GspK [Nitrospirota bacterium]